MWELYTRQIQDMEKSIIITKPLLGTNLLPYDGSVYYCGRILESNEADKSFDKLFYENNGFYFQSLRFKLFLSLRYSIN